jgi:hypothetical protein
MPNRKEDQPMTAPQTPMTREEAIKAIEGIREAFKDVPPEEIEREVERAIQEVREENRQRAWRRKGAAKVEREQRSV